MSKGLEALDKVARYCSDMRTMGKAREELNGELDVIFKDLERLEELKKVINKEYTHWKRIKYNDEMNGHSNNTTDYCVEFLSFLKEVLECQKD